jgi:type IV secretion system protein VirB8
VIVKRDPAVENYLSNSQGWELDRVKRDGRSKKLAWTIAGIASALAALAVLGITSMAITMRQPPPPVVIRVDSSSGVVDVVPYYEGSTNIEQIVTRHLLTGYVTARERFFYGTAETDYELVAAQNSPQLNQELLVAWDKANPQSPLNLYKDGTTVRVQVKSISFLKPASGKENVAQVRFSKAARLGGTGEEQVTHWITTIEFAYTKPSNDDKLRSMNPLGFRVLEYRKEPEVVATTTTNKGGQP